jgi:hypothetical protein
LFNLTQKLVKFSLFHFLFALFLASDNVIVQNLFSILICVNSIAQDYVLLQVYMMHKKQDTESH